MSESLELHSARKRLVHEYPHQIRACLDRLTEDEIWWRANESSNAIGNLIVHLCGSNQFYMTHAISGREFARDRDAEFAERTRIPREELRRRYDDMVAECERVLGALTPEDLLQQTDRTGKAGTTFAQILLHVTHHNAAHLGQIVYATKMLKEGAIHELWMKARQ